MPRHALLCLARLAASLGLVSIVCGQSTERARILETVWPLDEMRWMGWQQIDPATVYILEAGAEPREWDRLFGLPTAPARGRDRVLWAGRDFVAVGAADGRGAIENRNLTGDWEIVLGNTVGFVISDWEKVLFSADGVSWMPAKGVEVDWDNPIIDQAASADRFALLIKRSMTADGTTFTSAMVLTSSDGVEWAATLETEPQMGREPEVTRLAVLDGFWWATGPGVAYTSRDGVAWQDAAWADAPKETAEPTVALAEGTWAEGPEGWRHVSLDGTGRLQVRTLDEVLHPPAPDAEELLARWDAQEARIQAQAGLAGFYRELVGLVELLSESDNTALAEAARSAALQVVLQRADANGLQELRPLLSDQVFQDAMLMVQQGAQVLRAADPGASRQERALRGAAPEADQFDPTQTRRNLLQGVAGAAYDLALLHYTGNSLSRDQDLSAFWVQVFNQLAPGIDDFESPAGVAKLVAAGSGVAAGNTLGTFQISRGEASMRPEQWALLGQSAASGFKPSLRVREIRGAWLVDAAHLPEPVWPPEEASEWDEATATRNRALFEQHVAFARDLMAYRATLTPGEEPDRAGWDALVSRHAALLEDPDANALFPAYVRKAVAVAQLITSDDVTDAPWRMHMTTLKQAMAAVATNLESWLFRLRMLQWSGQLDEARRDATIASLLAELPVAKRERFHQLLAERVRWTMLELNLPAAVLMAPQQGYPGYNLQVAKSHAFTGQFDEADGALVEKLYANLGSRLWAAWRLPDSVEAAQVEADLYSIYQFDLAGLPYPPERLKEWQQTAAEIRAHFREKPEEALELMEELVTDAAHPDVLFQRALMLGQLRGPAEERAALERIVAGFPKWKLSPVQNRLGQLRDAQRDADIKASEATYAEALDLLNRGETAAGHAKLVEACATPFAVLPALHLLAEVEGHAGNLAKAEECLQQGYSAYPRDAAAGARLAMFMISQQRMDDAAKVLTGIGLAGLDAPEYQAVKRLHSALVIMQAEPSLAVAQAQAVVQRMDELKVGRFAPEVYAIAAQFRMVLGDRAGAVQDLIAMAEGRTYTPAQVWWQIAQAKIGSGDVPGAKPYAEKAARRGSVEAQTWLEQAR